MSISSVQFAARHRILLYSRQPKAEETPNNRHADHNVMTWFYQLQEAARSPKALHGFYLDHLQGLKFLSEPSTPGKLTEPSPFIGPPARKRMLDNEAYLRDSRTGYLDFLRRLPPFKMGNFRLKRFQPQQVSNDKYHPQIAAEFTSPRMLDEGFRGRVFPGHYHFINGLLEGLKAHTQREGTAPFSLFNWEAVVFPFRKPPKKLADYLAVPEGNMDRVYSFDPATHPPDFN